MINPQGKVFHLVLLYVVVLGSAGFFDGIFGLTVQHKYNPFDAAGDFTCVTTVTNATKKIRSKKGGTKLGISGSKSTGLPKSHMLHFKCRLAFGDNLMIKVLDLGEPSVLKFHFYSEICKTVIKNNIVLSLWVVGEAKRSSQMQIRLDNMAKILYHNMGHFMIITVYITL